LELTSSRIQMALTSKANLQLASSKHIKPAEAVICCHT
jgi:hypothetical protein